MVLLGPVRQPSLRGPFWLDCDLYVLPITKHMRDPDFVEAFNYINDTSEKPVIVIEDADTLFDDRKAAT